MSPFIVECLPGTVMASQKHTQTRLYSEGGGGRVGPTGGYIKAPQVKSYTTTTHELFVRLADGHERAVSLPFDNLAVREGQVVTLFGVQRAGTNTQCYARLVNHDTQVLYNVLSNEQWRTLVRATQGHRWTRPAPRARARGGLFGRARAALQRLGAEAAMGWHAAKDPTRAPSPTERAAPLAVALEHALEAALRQAGISAL